MTGSRLWLFSWVPAGARLITRGLELGRIAFSSSLGKGAVEVTQVAQHVAHKLGTLMVGIGQRELPCVSVHYIPAGMPALAPFLPITHLRSPLQLRRYVLDHPVPYHSFGGLTLAFLVFFCCVATEWLTVTKPISTLCQAARAGAVSRTTFLRSFRICTKVRRPECTLGSMWAATLAFPQSLAARPKAGRGLGTGVPSIDPPVQVPAQPAGSTAAKGADLAQAYRKCLSCRLARQSMVEIGSPGAN